MSDRQFFRILSLDGGGIRGLFPAAFLTHIEEQTRRPLAGCFDLIVGTSTGGIIALALARGVPAQDILRFYQEEGPRIFGKPRFLPLRISSPKYDAKPLYSALQKLFGETLIKEAKTKICITSYETITGNTRVFKTDHAEGIHWGGDQLMWKVAAATSAAPTYFPAFRIGEQDCHLDGGVWANNPVHVAITEAISRLGQKLENLAVISVGTGSRRFTVPYEKAARMGLFQWARPSFDLILGSQSLGADYEASFLLKKSEYIRVDVELPQLISLDDYKGSLPLIEHGYQAGRNNLEAVARILS